VTSPRRTVDALADWVASVARSDIAPATLEAARVAVLDLIGAAAAGRDVPAVAATRRSVEAAFGQGSVTIWFTPQHSTTAGAALANSAAASALDVDDGHRRASGHPGAAVIPAVLAQAEANGASGRDALAAIVVGYEIAVRAGSAFALRPDDTISTGHWCSIGAAAAAGRLAGLSRSELASALATAAAYAPRLVDLGSEAHGVKEGIAWSTHAGNFAVELARQGFQGPLEALDRRPYRPEVLLEGLGNDRPLIETAYIKPYASCRWSHAAIDATLELARHGLAAAEIESVTVETFGRAASLFNQADPRTLEAAQYSIPFCVALAVVGGPEALLPMRADELGRPDVIALARRIKVGVDPDLDRTFPARVPARVSVRAGGSEFSASVDVPRGDPANPLSRAEIEAKFRALIRDVPADGDEIIHLVGSLDSAPSIAALLGELQTKGVPATAQ
jgi:2-methylcitrate dehydratase PrpD